jgi:hypothetical protein
MTIPPVSFRSNNHPVPTPQTPQQPPQPTQQYFTGEEAQEEKKGTNPLLLLGGLALAGWTAFALLRKGKGAEKGVKNATEILKNVTNKTSKSANDARFQAHLQQFKPETKLNESRAIKKKMYTDLFNPSC